MWIKTMQRGIVNMRQFDHIQVLPFNAEPAGRYCVTGWMPSCEDYSVLSVHDTSEQANEQFEKLQTIMDKAGVLIRVDGETEPKPKSLFDFASAFELGSDADYEYRIYRVPGGWFLMRDEFSKREATYFSVKNSKWTPVISPVNVFTTPQEAFAAFNEFVNTEAVTQ